jgi:hypothetical protein
MVARRMLTNFGLYEKVGVQRVMLYHYEHQGRRGKGKITVTSDER